MKAFECEVTRVDKYRIEFDENIINEEFIKEYARYFYDYDTLEEHASNIAQMKARFDPSFFEGYGVLKIDGEVPWQADKCSFIEPGINITVLSEDEDIDVDVVEVKDGELHNS